MDNALGERYFDLNIEKILEGWEPRHAIRELIANALDEQILTGSSEITISRDADGTFRLRDFGRGLRYEHLTQNENAEKLANASRVIGKFGVGLKDALATLNRRGIRVRIISGHGEIALVAAPKHGFTDVVTPLRMLSRCTRRFRHHAILVSSEPKWRSRGSKLRRDRASDHQAFRTCVPTAVCRYIPS
jgi:hypothetical protein